MTAADVMPASGAVHRNRADRAAASGAGSPMHLSGSACGRTPHRQRPLSRRASTGAPAAPDVPVTAADAPPAAAPSIATTVTTAPAAAVPDSTPVTTAATVPPGAMAPPMMLAPAVLTPPIPNRQAPPPRRRLRRRRRSRRAVAPHKAHKAASGPAAETKLASNPPPQGGAFAGMQFGNSKAPIYIKSKSMSLDYQNHSVLWTGDVHATQADAQLTSDSCA